MHSHSFYKPVHLQGHIDLLSLIRYLNDDQRMHILNKINKVDDEKLKQFVALIHAATNAEVLRLSTEEISVYTLAALNRGLIKQEQAVTMHQHIAVLIEFFQYPHDHTGSTPLTATDGELQEAFVGDIATQIEIHRFDALKLQNIFQQNMGMTDAEWEHFCQLMERETASEQYYYAYKVPDYFTENPSINDIFRRLQAFNIISHEGYTLVLSPSFTMRQKRLEVLASHFGEQQYFQIQPSFGDITEQQIETLKASGRIQFALPCPLLAPVDETKKISFYFMEFHTYKGCGPYSFINHDYFHAIKDSLTKTKHRDAHYLMLNFLRDYAKTLNIEEEQFTLPRLKRLIESIIDGDATRPTMQTEHQYFIECLEEPRTFNHSLNMALSGGKGSDSAWYRPGFRRWVTPMFDAMRDGFQQYQNANSDVDIKESFDINPEQDFEMVTNTDSWRP